jgi:hypothetical protein
LKPDEIRNNHPPDENVFHTERGIKVEFFDIHLKKYGTNSAVECRQNSTGIIYCEVVTGYGTILSIIRGYFPDTINRGDIETILNSLLTQVDNRIKEIDISAIQN